MATFKTLPAGVMRGDPRDVYPLLDKDNLPVGFTSSQGDTFMATYATDPLTGENILKTSSAYNQGRLPLNLPQGRRQFLVKPEHNLSLSATATITRHAAMVLPGVSWKAYKLRLINAHTAPITYAAAVTTQSAIGDALYSAGTWDAIKFSGASTVAVPAGSGTTPNFIPGYVDSDVVYTPSQSYNGGTIAAVRTYCATANNTKCDIASGFLGTLGGQGFYTVYSTAGDFATTPATWSGTTSFGAFPPFALIGYSDNQIKRIALFGSSTLSGQADDTSAGWAWRTQNALSSTTIAYQFVNEAMPGALTSVNLTRALTGISADVYDSAVFSIFSSNDSSASDWATNAYLDRLKGQIWVFIDACKAKGVWPILATFQAITGYTGVPNTQRLAINAYANTLAASGVCGIFDIASVFSDETQATGTWKNLTWTSDGTHPNGAGSVVLAAYAATVFI